MRTFFASMGALLIAAVVVGCGGARGQTANVQPGPMPPGGTWDSVFQSPAYGRMEFTVEGNQVIGLYEGERHYGRIEGQIDGNVLWFNWTQWKTDLQGKLRETTGRGYFKYVVEVEQASTRTREVHKIVGSWGYQESLDDGGPWEAIRLERAKKMLKPHTAAESDGSDDDMSSSAGFDTGGDQDTSIEMSEPESKDKPKKEEPEDSLDSLF